MEDVKRLEAFAIPRIHLTKSGLVKALWLLVAATFPLFSVEFARYNNLLLRMHVALPMLFMGLLVGLGALLIAGRQGRISRLLLGGKYARLVMVAGFLLWTWHVVEMARANDFPLALREVMKLGYGLVCAMLALLFFPRDERFMERFWKVAIWTSAALFVFLIYQYAVVWRSAYLGTYLDQASREGKNQMGSYLVYITPFALAYLQTTRWKFVASVPTLILTIALIYGGSRGAWLGVAAGLLSLTPVLARAYGIKRVAGFLVLAGIFVYLGIWSIQTYLGPGNYEFARRFMYLIDPSAAPELQSYEDRSDKLERVWEVFITSPFIGVGLTNTYFLPHNDFVRIFSDLGVVGGALFLVVAGNLVLSVGHRRRNYSNHQSSPADFSINSRAGTPVHSSRAQRIWWVALGSRAAVIGALLFMCTMDRIYTTTAFWAVVGLALVAYEIEKKR